MSGETEKQVSGWTVDTLKEHIEVQIGELNRALVLSKKELERRLEGLNELRSEVEDDRTQFVKVEVYAPAHEELRRQRVIDSERITIIQGDVKNNATDIAAMKNSVSWLTRLILGAVILGVIAYAFQRMGG